MSSAVYTAEPAAVRQRAARGRWWLLDRLALGWSVLSALALYALIGRGGWFADDFLTFGQARQYPLSRYVRMTTLGHPQPGVRLFDWLLYRIAPMNYPFAAALECLAFGFMAWLLYRILRMVFQPSPWHLVLTAMLGTTALWVPAAAWWAAGPEVGGCALANLLTVYALLRCHRGPNRLLWGALTGGALVLGLGCYERALFGGAFAAWFLPAVACRSMRPRQVLAVLRRARAGYLALAGVTAGYLACYLGYHLAQRHPGYSRSELLHFEWVCWSHVLIPGLFGGTLRTHPNLAESYADPPLWWLTGCQLALLALVGYGLLRNRLRALLAWLVFGMLFVVGQYLIARARLTIFGVGIGNEFRYVADLLPLLILTVAISLLHSAETAPAAQTSPAETAPAESLPPSEQSGRDGLCRRHLAATGAGLAALCTVFLVTALPVSHRWTHGRNVGYARNLRAGVAELDRRGPWSLYSSYASTAVIWSTGGSYGQTTAVAALLTGHPVSADDLSKPMYVADPDGRLRPARFRPLATVGPTCGGDQVMQRLSRPLPKGFWNVQLAYRVRTPSTLGFEIDPGTGSPVEATGTYRRFRVSGSGQLTFLMQLSAVTGFQLDASAPGACISDVRIGVPVAAG